MRDRLDEALDALDRAEALIRKDGDDALETELYYRRGDILFAPGRAEECLTAHEQAEKLSRKSRDSLLDIRALAGMADAYYAQGRMLAQALQRPVDAELRQQAEELIEKARIAGLYFGVTELQAVAVE